MVYTYLAGEVGSSTCRGQGAFRALSQGYNHRASGRLSGLEINHQNPEYCHVRAMIKQSIKCGNYKVYILLRRNGEFSSVAAAACECTAGYVHSYLFHHHCIYMVYIYFENMRVFHATENLQVALTFLLCCMHLLQ